MPGVSVGAWPVQDIPITVEGDEYTIARRYRFTRTADDVTLIDWTKRLLPHFKALERAVVDHKSIDLGQDEGLKKIADKQTEALITWGHRAYNQFFKEQTAKDALDCAIRFQEGRKLLPAPSFVLRKIPFPWELLYPIEMDLVPEGDDPVDYFWGMRYPVSRNLTSEGFEQHVLKQSPDSNMLFGLHDTLRHAHQDEWPKLRDLVTARGTINILGGQAGPQKTGEKAIAGKDVLKYLYTSEHNIVHFACHCVPAHGEDVLLLSLLKDASVIKGEGVVGDPDEVRLGTFAFLDASGVFETKQPLVFLNACQTTGDTDTVGIQFNLPEEFVQKKAAGVIATICPVPDIFAAAFAGKFYQLFLAERAEIGEALRATRAYFWEECHNPLGLAYGLYSSPFYRVGEQAKQGGLLK
jgi:hypothetical protein